MCNDPIQSELARATRQDHINGVGVFGARYAMKVQCRAVRSKRQPTQRPHCGSNSLAVCALRPGEPGHTWVHNLNVAATNHPIPRRMCNAARVLDDESVSLQRVLIEFQESHTVAVG